MCATAVMSAMSCGHFNAPGDRCVVVARYALVRQPFLSPLALLLFPFPKVMTLIEE